MLTLCSLMASIPSLIPCDRFDQKKKKKTTTFNCLNVDKKMSINGRHYVTGFQGLIPIQWRQPRHFHHRKGPLLNILKGVLLGLVPICHSE